MFDPEYVKWKGYDVCFWESLRFYVDSCLLFGGEDDERAIAEGFYPVARDIYVAFYGKEPDEEKLKQEVLDAVKSYLSNISG